MNCVIYGLIQNKKINGSLFYAFEYFAFVKQNTDIDIKFILFDASEDDLNYIKEVFRDKYTVSEDILNCMMYYKKPTTLLKLGIKQAMMFDMRTYSKVRPFIKGKIHCYYNKLDFHCKQNDKDSFYGFYSYQPSKFQTRLKFYTDIHKTFEEHGDETFISSPWAITEDITDIIDVQNPLTKDLNTHIDNLFKRINKIIYWHNGTLDANNRIVVEAAIHGIEIDIHFNNNENDSVYERYQALKDGIHKFVLTTDDIMIKNFVKDCYEQNSTNNQL